MCVPVLHVLARSGDEFNVNATRGGIPPCSVYGHDEENY